MGERRVDVIISTELAGFGVAPIGALPASITDGVESESTNEEAQTQWNMARGDETEALT